MDLMLMMSRSPKAEKGTKIAVAHSMLLQVFEWIKKIGIFVRIREYFSSFVLLILDFEVSRILRFDLKSHTLSPVGEIEIAFNCMGLILFSDGLLSRWPWSSVICSAYICLESGTLYILELLMNSFNACDTGFENPWWQKHRQITSYTDYSKTD